MSLDRDLEELFLRLLREDSDGSIDGPGLRVIAHAYAKGLRSPVDDEHLKALGQVVVSFNELEFALKLYIFVLLGMNYELGEVVTSQLSFRNLVDVFGSLCRYRGGESEMEPELRKLCAKLAQVEEKRNQLIHSEWSGDFDGAVMRSKTTARARRGRKVQIEYLKREDWKDFFSCISETDEALNTFYATHFADKNYFE